jgi:hypothetical protein
MEREMYAVQREFLVRNGTYHPWARVCTPCGIADYAKRCGCRCDRWRSPMREAHALDYGAIPTRFRRGSRGNGAVPKLLKVLIYRAVSR